MKNERAQVLNVIRDLSPLRIFNSLGPSATFVEINKRKTDHIHSNNKSALNEVVDAKKGGLT